jgi:ribonucleotide reductase alpha subunit
MTITVVKRSGVCEPLTIEKWQAQVAKICQGIADVSQSMIEIRTQLHFYDGITTKEIDGITLRAIVDLINVESNPDVGHTNYQYVAGKQRLSMLRKDVYGSYNPPHLYEIIKKNVATGLYTPELLEWYTEEDWDRMDSMLDHEKDEQYSYAAIEQLIEKYLVRNRATKEIYETPQVRYMVAAATVFHREEPNQARMRYIKEYYTAASDGLFTLATPVLAGLGTPTKQFSSCVLIRSDDDLDSIFASGEMMAKYAAKRAGIGLEIGRLRPLGSPIRGGEIMHTGMIPFLKKWFGDLRSCCVTPDTWVEILDEDDSANDDKKTKKIQIRDLIPGMKIKTRAKSGQIVFKTVTDKFNTTVMPADQVRLEFENGVILNCSINHPIMILDGAEIIQKTPNDLTSDDRVLTEMGFTRLLVADFGQNNDINYIDITVEDEHTFFASSSNNDPMVLTHNSQGGIRNASCTVYFPIWHYQFDDLIVLKNNQGTEETRVRHLDYAVVLSKFFWRRFKNKEDITFFDPNEVPDLYEAFYRDIEEFEELYVKYEKRTDLRKKIMNAEEVFKGGILKERTDTGRIYLMFTDNVQKQGPFDPKVHPIYQSNLCAEVVLPNKSFKRLDDDKGRISLCTLGSINWGAFRNPEDMRRACRILQRSLNNILDYQDFLSIQSKLSNDEIRPIGIGVTNLAYWHAKRGLKYGELDALQDVKTFMEHQAFYLTEATVELARERGACLDSDKTRYGQGVFPWELRADGVNELADFTPELDWETLRVNMKQWGVRNATLMAIAPVESCQSWENRLSLADGTTPNFHELLELANIDWKEIERTAEAGDVIKLPIPIDVNGQHGVEKVTEVIYNGFKPLNQITFEDGTIMKFTDNHRLLVNRDGVNTWVYVFELKEGDDIVQVEQQDLTT